MTWAENKKNLVLKRRSVILAVRTTVVNWRKPCPLCAKRLGTSCLVDHLRRVHADEVMAMPESEFEKR